MGQNIQLQDDNGFGLIQEQNRTAMSNIANVVALNTQRRRAQAETLAGLTKLKNLNPDKFRNAEIGVTEEGQILGNDQYNNGLNLNKKDLSVAGGDTKYDMQFGSTLGKDKINQLTNLRNAINGTTPGPAMQNRINNDANDSDAINETKDMVTDPTLNSNTYKVPTNVIGRGVGTNAGTSPQFQSVATSTASGKHDEAGVTDEMSAQQGNSSITGNDYALTKETNDKQWIDTTKDDLEALKANMVMESTHNNAMAAMGVQGGSKTFENMYNDRLKELYGRSKVLEEKGMTTQKLEHLGSTSLEATGQSLQESQSAHYGKSANTSYSSSINTGNQAPQRESLRALGGGMPDFPVAGNSIINHTSKEHILPFVNDPNALLPYVKDLVPNKEGWVTVKDNNNNFQVKLVNGQPTQAVMPQGGKIDRAIAQTQQWSGNKDVADPNVTNRNVNPAITPYENTAAYNQEKKAMKNAAAGMLPAKEGQSSSPKKPLTKKEQKKKLFGLF